MKLFLSWQKQKLAMRLKQLPLESESTICYGRLVRFVILEHDFPTRHWDLMLEEGSSLSTWQLPTPPQIPSKVLAKKLPNHRTLYLDYEGPISNNRGRVVRWDRGTYQVLSPQSNLQAKKYRLNGERTSAIMSVLQSSEGELIYFEALA